MSHASGASRPARSTVAARDRRLDQLLRAWFERDARDLPWRQSDPPHPDSAHASGRDPYVCFVAEAMLQQTQVSRVLEKLGPFIERFQSVRALADADEDDVLALWSGLGYYRRARNLHAAAKQIVARHDARVPSDAPSLRELPGVGPYTAGAIASIVFGSREPTVDGNIARVLLRLEGREVEESPRAREAWAWARARELIRATAEPGPFNEALMELGALVCTPAAPRCEECPLASRCVARATGRQHAIPTPKPAVSRASKQRVFHACVLVPDARGRLLVQQRPAKGMWSRLWQPPTLERSDRPADAGEIARALHLATVERQGAFIHETTHRRVCFEVWRGKPQTTRAKRNGRWLTREQISQLALSNPHRAMLLSPPPRPPNAPPR